MTSMIRSPTFDVVTTSLFPGLLNSIFSFPHNLIPFYRLVKAASLRACGPKAETFSWVRACGREDCPPSIQGKRALEKATKYGKHMVIRKRASLSTITPACLNQPLSYLLLFHCSGLMENKECEGEALDKIEV